VDTALARQRLKPGSGLSDDRLDLEQLGFQLDVACLE